MGQVGWVDKAPVQQDKALGITALAIVVGLDQEDNMGQAQQAGKVVNMALVAVADQAQVVNSDLAV